MDKQQIVDMPITELVDAVEAEVAVEQAVDAPEPSLQHREQALHEELETLYDVQQHAYGVQGFAARLLQDEVVRRFTTGNSELLTEAAIGKAWGNAQQVAEITIGMITATAGRMEEGGVAQRIKEINDELSAIYDELYKDQEIRGIGAVEMGFEGARSREIL